MTEDELAWVDRYASIRFLLVNSLADLSRAEEDVDEVLRPILYKHRMSVLNQLALIEGRSRFVVIAGNQPSEPT